MLAVFLVNYIRGIADNPVYLAGRESVSYQRGKLLRITNFLRITAAEETQEEEAE
ncbi:MAG: hypothetical protein II402_08330 [Bacteroidaceae bacterium]|nr:hypothetical protein [Bacteroidaceae bacterium]